MERILREQQMMFQIVEFSSTGTTLRGRLYRPVEVSNAQPVIVMAHGFSATINGMVAEKYAEVFYQAGFAVLLYDHPNFGMSDGEPRQEINRWIQARGYRDAIDFVTTLPGIDKDQIAIWGDSMSGCEAIIVGAVDGRVKAVVAQVPACGDNMPPEDHRDGQSFESIKGILLHGDVQGTAESTTGPLPVVSFDQMSTPSLLTPLTAFHWFIQYGARYGTNWENHATVVVPKTPAPFHPFLCAPYLKAALQMIIAVEDEMPGANSSIARKVFERAPQPKELIEMDGGHFGLLYYPGELFDRASHAQKDFLVRHLMQP